jgi:hypothetical protein
MYYHLDFCTVWFDATLQLLIKEVHTFQTFVNLKETFERNELTYDKSQYM